jgi:hypothetical protein
MATATPNHRCLFEAVSVSKSDLKGTERHFHELTF